MEEYNIQMDTPKEMAKTIIENKNKEDIIQHVEQEALKKSKTKHWLEKQDKLNEVEKH